MSHKHNNNNRRRANDDEEDNDDMVDTSDFFTGMNSNSNHAKNSSSLSSSNSTTVLGKRGAAKRDAEASDANQKGISIPGTNRVLLPAVGTRVISSEAEWKEGSAADSKTGREAVEKRMLELLKQRHLSNKKGGDNGNPAALQPHPSKKAKKAVPRR